MTKRIVWVGFCTAAVLGLGAWGCTFSNPVEGGGGSSSTAGSGSTTAGTTGASGSSTGAAGTAGTAGTAGSGGGVNTTTGVCSKMAVDETKVPVPPAEGMPKGPCDIYKADGGPCVAAHSTVRALFGTYAGPLYQVRKKVDGTTLDIKPKTPGGFADGAAQDTFCGTDACTISIIYDQSGWENHLTKSPPGAAKPTPNDEANAKSVPGTFGGNNVYGVHVVPGIGYRNNSACGTAVGDEAQTIYMVAAQGAYNGGCCFDYGNMERNSRDNGEGTMEAVYYGTCTIWGKGADAGPWIMGDLENGLWAGDSSPYANNKPIPADFKYVVGMVKGDAPGKDHWVIKTGNAQSGTLIKPFDGRRPSDRYRPMRKEGAIGLGTGGDNSSAAKGDFFEGLMTHHFSSDAADDAVQANIVAAYGAM